MAEIKYIVELAQRTEYPPERALSVSDIDKQYNIFILETGHPTVDTYWTDWGGTYDNPTLPDMELFFSQFLQRVTSQAVLILTEFSFYVENEFVYINLSRKPWQFAANVTELASIEGYASAPKDGSNPSDIFYNDALGNPIKYPTRLLVPSVAAKLSDPISGTALQTTFRFSLINNDGFFDNTTERNYYNTPVRIKRTTVANPTLADFQTIRYGLADSFDVSSDIFAVTAADINRTLTEPVCRKFTLSDFPSASTQTVDKDIPIAYGSVNDIDLFEVGINQYIAIDPDYVVSIDAVYNSQGNSISFTVDHGVITVTESDGEGGIQDGVTADVTGLSNNRIGEIITSELENKGNIPYRDGPWDKAEADQYVNNSAKLNFYFPGGTLKKLIEEVLKNDNAFFITKNDGRLTLRQWGTIYTSHEIPSWMIMEIPRKNTAEGKKYYMSAVSIRYGRRWKSNTYDFEVFDDSDEPVLFERYRKAKQVTFDTVLSTGAEASNLATRLLDRFGIISEDIKIKEGYDCSDVNLLDTVIQDLNINGRQFSGSNQWIVTEVDPAQDTLTLESLDTYTVTIDGIPSQPTTNDVVGYPSQPTTEDYAGIPSQLSTVNVVEV